ncbi:unnamed protein product [Hydatigera taeniaeformis]|uniref:BZIP domain-containing protein n=1 Tax=Hydatigena taeniaeformis TaxID=6205 RepID=A0A0R3X8K8_HYDTA|nr:unnamed protein product [Hydatigera taeniaeformis]
MSAGDIGDWEDQVSPDDISLAASNLRRKSIRRSMMVIPASSDSPIGYSSPKIVVRRKSLGTALKNDCTSSLQPVSPLSGQGPEHMKVYPGHLPTSPRPPDDTSPDEASPSHSHAGAQFSDPHVESLSRKYVKNSDCRKSPTSYDTKSLPNSVDALFENYERELSEWPRLLNRLEHGASFPLQKPCMKLEEMIGNSMLNPFVEFISSNKSSSAVNELQRRTKWAYRSVMTGLVRTKLAYKKLRYSVAALERRNAELKNAKLKDLLPHLALNPSPMSARDLLAFIPCLREGGELPL